MLEEQRRGIDLVYKMGDLINGVFTPYNGGGCKSIAALQPPLSNFFSSSLLTHPSSLSSTLLLLHPPPSDFTNASQMM